MATLAGHTNAAPVAWTRAVRNVLLLLAGASLLALIAYQVWKIATYGDLATFIGYDYRTYMAATERWLAGGPFYEPYQVAGPYPVVAHEILYPPPVLLLLAPFTVLPAVLWYAIPVGIITAVVVWRRPAPWGWVAILACLALPIQAGLGTTLLFIGNGNPGLWVAAVVALATRWPAAGPWVLLKPTLAPFALVGIRRRSWWIGAAAFVVACLAFLPMWGDYVAVLVNARTPGPPLLYSLANVPICLIPVIAMASSRGTPRPR